MKKKDKIKIPWTTWLIFAVIVSALVSTTTLSRYITTISGGGNAMVASVMIDSNLNINIGELTPGETKTIAFTVNNYNNSINSDVAQEYSISIESTYNLPLIFTLESTDVNTNHALTKNNNENIWTGGVFPTQNTSHEYNLIIQWNGTNIDPKYAEEIDAIKIIVNSTQQDPTT